MYETFWFFQPPFTHCMRPQADFQICCVVFSPLQNGKKKFKKMVCLGWNEAHSVVELDSVFRKNLLWIRYFFVISEFLEYYEMLRVFHV